METKLLYRPAEAARVLGMGRTKLWQLVKKGMIETRRVDGMVFVTAAELQRFASSLPKAT